MGDWAGWGAAGHLALWSACLDVGRLMWQMCGAAPNVCLPACVLVRLTALLHFDSIAEVSYTAPARSSTRLMASQGKCMTSSAACLMDPG